MSTSMPQQPVTTQYPYSAVVAIDVQFPNGKEVGGSGVMIGPDEVLTASHVVWQQDWGGEAIHVTVAPALDHGATPFGTVEVVGWHDFHIKDPGDVLEPAAAAQDIALLHLSQPVGYQTGWMGIDPSFASGAIHVTGYPIGLAGVNYDMEVMIDRVVDAKDYHPGMHDFAADPLSSLSLVAFNVGTANHGDSGGPLWHYDADGMPEVVGVFSVLQDAGPLLTPELVGDLEQWASQDHALV